MSNAPAGSLGVYNFGPVDGDTRVIVAVKGTDARGRQRVILPGANAPSSDAVVIDATAETFVSADSTVASAVLVVVPGDMQLRIDRACVVCDELAMSGYATWTLLANSNPVAGFVNVFVLPDLFGVDPVFAWVNGPASVSMSITNPAPLGQGANFRSRLRGYLFAEVDRDR